MWDRLGSMLVRFLFAVAADIDSKLLMPLNCEVVSPEGIEPSTNRLRVVPRRRLYVANLPQNST